MPLNIHNQLLAVKLTSYFTQINVHLTSASYSHSKCTPLYQLEVFEEFEDTKGVIRIRKSTKNRETTQWPKK